MKVTAEIGGTGVKVTAQFRLSTHIVHGQLRCATILWVALIGTVNLLCGPMWLT